jgi:heptaprenyl diphosphate synthase
MSQVLQTTTEDYRIAWLAALAITIHIIESTLPSPAPGIKPGLANVIVIAVLMLYGWRTAVWVSLLRVLVGSLLTGTFLSPTFVLSLSGAVASVAILLVAMQPGKLLPAWGFGPVGYSVLAAMAHMAGQFMVAYWLFIPHPSILYLLPILMSMAVIFGIVSGMITAVMIKRVAV